MKRFVLHRRGPSNTFCILYGAMAEWMRVGVGKDVVTGEIYPNIEILYPQDLFPSVLQIAQEMGRLGLSPEVFFDKEINPTYVAVFFRLKQLRLDFLRQLFPREYLLIARELPSQGGELIMSGEAEFATEDLRHFFALYPQKRCLRLILLQQLEGVPTPAWGVQLPGFSYGRPHVL